MVLYKITLNFKAILTLILFSRWRGKDSAFFVRKL